MFVYVVPIWLSGNALVPIYLVTLREARLVHGCVTILVNHLCAEPGIRSTKPEPCLCDDMFVYVVPIWLSGNALVPIYLVTLRQVRLVHGWVTVL